MNILFNLAQLSRPQRENLIEVLGFIETDNDQEIEVRAIEFPSKFAVKLDEDDEDKVILLGWDVEKEIYYELPKPEKPDELGIGAKKVEGPEPIPEPKPTPEPELDLSPVIERAEALARALVKLSKPLNLEQRMETWMKFCIVLSKELWK